MNMKNKRPNPPELRKLQGSMVCMEDTIYIKDHIQMIGPGQKNNCSFIPIPATQHLSNFGGVFIAAYFEEYYRLYLAILAKK